jgi:Na+/proline symporter
MRGTIGNFVIEILGAFVVWAFKGFKGTISDEMSGPHESNFKTWRNFLITIIVVLLVVAVIEKLQKPENETGTYKIEIINKNK